MGGICYLIISFLTGGELASVLFDKKKKTGTTNEIWTFMAAAFGLGTLFLTWAVYLLAWAFSVLAGLENPLLPANVIVLGTAAAWLSGIYFLRKKRKKPLGPWSGRIGNQIYFRREAAAYFVLLMFLMWIMFYVFFFRNGVIYAGFSVFGDYAPHTAMIRSFSVGNNFPTQYPHFGGADVKYHFMFQFFTGNLEYLGMRLDIAYNVAGALSLWAFLVMLSQFVQRLFGGAAGSILVIFLFLFRSGTALFQYVWEHLKAGDLWSAFLNNTAFLGYTPNEDWGLWNFNVYLNQRHLAFGLLLVLTALWVFLEWLEAGTGRETKGVRWLGECFFTKTSWKSRDLEKALLLGMMLGLCAFWNGAAVIGGLLILLGFAVFSDGKLDYAAMAGVTIFFSVIQSRFFIRGSAVSPSVYIGFIAENKSLTGMLAFLLEITGFVFIGLILAALFLKRRERCMCFAFWIPVIFTFTFSLTPDVTVNHKYIMIAYAFTIVLWAYVLQKLFSSKWWKKVLAVVMLICLTATGLYDFVIILRRNGPNCRIAVNAESELTGWLEENLKKDDLILTPEYSMNEVTMSGVMLYCGWPYYAWSAGYDTNYRAAKAVEIYTSDDKDTLKRLTKEENITYILYEQDMMFEETACREDVIAGTFPLVYSSEDGRIRIYETR